MRGYIQKIRPAGSAIAAVLALGSTYAFAQEAPAPVAPPPAAVIVPPPVAPVPAPAEAQPMVQPTAPVEERIAAARAAAEQEAAESAPAPAATRESRVSRATPVQTPAAAPVAEQRATPPAPAPATTVPVRSVSAAEPAPAVVPPAATDRVAEESAVTTDWTLPAALGAGALLLLGLGAAAFMRRRRAAVSEPEADLPLHAPEPVVAPAAPAVRSPLAQPMPSATAHGDLAAMVAAPPSAENPFRTRHNRMRRARFLLAQQENRANMHRPAQIAPVPPQTIHTEPQMQTVYRMGGDRSRRMSFRPQTR
ncbi:MULTISPECIES: hypothetical protein [Sphingobium]|uniref:hypothetical protein n=1 Tax=Sphingobium TaxID=165695 RepID=UPI00041AD935|nr:MULTISPECIES: hypothetical protein [Sphingobium]